ncbi:MAG: amidohydrolase [Phycisphaerales bacterium]
MTARPRRLREAHAHIAQHGRAMTMLDLSDCRDRDDCLERVAARARAMAGAPRETWLLGHALRVQAWRDPAWPDAQQLDEAAGNRPCCVWSFDHHALAANTAAMRVAGVDRGSPDPEHGRIVRDGRGEPTGLFLERGAWLIWSRIPDDPPAVRRAQVKAALADLAGHGFVEVDELLAPAWLGPLLAELDDAGELVMPVNLYVPYAEFDQAVRTAPEWTRGRVKLAGAKLFADGTLNARTAWMLAPFADPLPGLPCGQPMLTREQIGDALARMSSLGLTLAVHAIGDGAVRCCLDAAGLSDSPSFLRVEHAEIIDPADVPRFARLGVACSVQPCHLLADIEALRRGLPHRLDRVLPLRELIDSGCRPGERLWFGSDVPIVRPHPSDSIQAAVHRRRAGEPTDARIAPEQAIKEEEAWAAFAPDCGHR